MDRFAEANKFLRFWDRCRKEMNYLKLSTVEQSLILRHFHEFFNTYYINGDSEDVES